MSGRTVVPELQMRNWCQRHGLPIGDGSTIQEGHMSAPCVFLTQHCRIRRTHCGGLVQSSLNHSPVFELMIDQSDQKPK